VLPTMTAEIPFPRGGGRSTGEYFRRKKKQKGYEKYEEERPKTIPGARFESDACDSMSL